MTQVWSSRFYLRWRLLSELTTDHRNKWKKVDFPQRFKDFPLLFLGLVGEDIQTPWKSRKNPPQDVVAIKILNYIRSKTTGASVAIISYYAEVVLMATNYGKGCHCEDYRFVRGKGKHLKLYRMWAVTKLTILLVKKSKNTLQKLSPHNRPLILRTVMAA